MMSGFEIVGVVLGAPIIIEAIKSYQDIRDKLQIFRSKYKTIRSLQLQLRTEESKFRHECTHLLRSAGGSELDLQSLEGSSAGLSQHGENVSESLKRWLSDDYDICKQIVEEIRDILQEISRDLSKSNAQSPELTESNTESQRVGDSGRHLRQSLAIALNKQRYEDQLGRLRSWNADLSDLRKRLCDSQRLRSSIETCIIHKAIPTHVAAIQKASQKLYETLVEAWCCANATHVGHWVKLWLDAQAENDAVRLEMAISSRIRDVEASQRRQIEPSVWLYVQSISLNAQMSYALPASVSSLTATVQEVAATFDKHFAIEDSPEQVITPKNVEAVEEDNSPVIEPHPPTNELDLRQANSICCLLNQKICSTEAACTGGCLGYLEASNSLRYDFYAPTTRDSACKDTADGRERKPSSLEQLLGNLSMLDQLTLAHKIANAILQYQSTPRISDQCCLRDLAFFTSQSAVSGLGTLSEEARKELQTLYLSIRFPESNTAVTIPMEGVEVNGAAALSSTVEDVQYTYGISNMTLCNLGLTLLELGYRKPLRELRAAQDPHAVVSGRKLLSGLHTSLGPRYQEIVRRCIQCDFSSGTDLSQPRLQSAVYNDVICPLEDMINGFKKLTTVT